MVKLAFTCARQLLTSPRARLDRRLRRSLKRWMKLHIPLFALGILVSVFANSLLADPETSAAIKDQNQKLIAELPGRSLYEATPAYKRADLPVDERVGDLLGRMTVEEKARQLDMYYGCQDLVDKKQTIDNHTHAKPDAVFDPRFAEKNLGSLGVGSIHDLYPSARLYNTVQAWVIRSSRLGIPALFLEEGLHGYMGYDQTIAFPSRMA